MIYRSKLMFTIQKVQINQLQAHRCIFMKGFALLHVLEDFHQFNAIQVFLLLL